MSKITIELPMISYLKGLTKGWGTTFATKTYGGQVWLSDEAPGELFEDEDKNYIEFNNSDFYTRLPKVVWKYIEIEKGSSEKLSKVINDIKKLEID